MAHTPRSARILAASLALLLPCTGCRHRTASALRPDAATLARIDTLAATWMGRRSVPGLSIAIASHGQLLFARGYGVAALSGDRAGPATPETVFELGSIKKPVTAAIVLQLAERRLVDVDSPASRWIEQINTMVPVRVRDMLNQVSGLPEVDDTTTVRELDFEPRTRWAYRNANFDLLDVLVEKATGRAFNDYLAHSMMDSLGLHSLHMCNPAEPHNASMAEGHTLRDSTLTPVPDACWFRGTPGELALWADALFEGRIVSEASLDAMTTPVTLTDGTRRDYGFGLRLRPHRGMVRFSHTGHVAGFTASFGYYPAAGLAIAVAGNSDSFFDPDALEVALASLLTGAEPPDVEVVNKGGAERFVGVYDAGDVSFRVAGAGGDSLILSMTPTGENAPYLTTRLVRVGETRFVGADSPDVIEVRFAPHESSDAPTGAVFDVVGIPWEATRRVP